MHVVALPPCLKVSGVGLCCAYILPCRWTHVSLVRVSTPEERYCLVSLGVESVFDSRDLTLHTSINPHATVGFLSLINDILCGTNV